MNSPQEPQKSKKFAWLGQALAFIEYLGNKLPDPLTLFFLLSLLVIIVSAIAGCFQSLCYPPRKR